MPSVSSRSNVTTFCQPVGLGSPLSMAHLLETCAELIVVRELDRSRDLVVGQTFTAKRHHATLEHVERLGRQQLEARRYELPHHGLSFSEHGDVLDILQLQEHVLDLCRIDLLTANVDQIRGAAEDAQIFAVYLDGVLGVEPT